MSTTINLELWSSPLSFMLAAAFLIGVFLCWKSSVPHWLKHLKTIRFSLIIITVILVFMAMEGTWGGDWFHTWPFVISMLLMLIPLGMVSLNGWKHHPNLYALFSHIGLFLILFGGLFGAADVTDAQMIVDREHTQHLAITSKNQILPVPFKAQLKDFRIDFYDDGVSPKQFTSTLLIDGQEMETSVNHPCNYKGWNIYQSDFDPNGFQYTVLKVVRDPWLPVVYTGMLIMVLGAIMGLKQAWKSWKVIPLMLLLTALFTSLSLARINLGTLMPALRSIWFVPHIFVYMIAYSLLAIASVAGVWELWKKKSSDFSVKMLITASQLLLIGMLCGAVWAKEAWGQYWTWDAKECWAAVTWMITLVGTHLNPIQQKKRVVLSIIVAFLAMQITWYGVNYLPAAQNSMHTYNSN